MRIFRASYKDRKGRARKASRWYVEFRDHNETARRVPAFSDKGASAELGRKLQRLAALRATRETIPAEMSKWIEGLAPRLREKLADIDMLDTRRLAASRPLAELLDEFKATLRTRERTEDWIAHVLFRVRVTLEGAGFATLSDIEPAAIERHLHALRSGDIKSTCGALGRRKAKADDEEKTTLSARESNHRLQACREFTRWALAAHLIASDPLVSLAPVNAALDPRHTRRALRPADLQKLVAAAHNGATFRGVSGEVRAMVWRLAAQAGLRVGEIQALQVRHVELNGPNGPSLTVSASISKNRTEARVPLAIELADVLAPWIRGRLPAAFVLPLPASFKHKAALWLRFDLERAEIPYRDDSGRVADVHSLRSSFVAELVRSGANVKAIQRLARHKSPLMTLGIYARLDARDERNAIDGFPSLSPEPGNREKLRATGTDGASVLASCLPSKGAVASTSMPLDAGLNGPCGPENAFATAGVVAVEGFEPPTYGL